MHEAVSQPQRVKGTAGVGIVVEHKMTSCLHQPDVGHEIGHKALHLKFHHLEWRDQKRQSV